MSDTPLWLWGALAGTVAVLLVADLASNRGGRRDHHRNATVWTAIWIGAGLGFNALVWASLGADPAQEYLAAYVIEQSLSLDNLFVFLLIFRTLHVPPAYQHRVLFWGILGAVVFRAVFILAGTSAIQRWSWLTFVFGATLLYAGYRALRQHPAEMRRSPVLDWLSRRVAVTPDIRGHEFVVEQDGRREATPLLLALISIELTDIVFAIDSIPAVLSVTQDPFVVYSSNVFAILALRSLYGVLARTITRLTYLRYALAGVLIFAGSKLLLSRWIHVPSLVSVGVIVALLAAVVVPHLLHGRHGRHARP